MPIKGDYVKIAFILMNLVGYIQNGLFWSSKQDLALQEVIASRNTKLNERQCLFCVPYVTLSCTTC